MAHIVGDLTWQSNLYGDIGGVHAWTKFKRPPDDCRKGIHLYNRITLEICFYTYIIVKN
jgi:hypothetical protein